MFTLAREANTQRKNADSSYARRSERAPPHLLGVGADGVGRVVSTDAGHLLQTRDYGGRCPVVFQPRLVELVESVCQARQPAGELCRESHRSLHVRTCGSALLSQKRTRTRVGEAYFLGLVCPLLQPLPELRVVLERRVVLGEVSQVLQVLRHRSHLFHQLDGLVIKRMRITSPATPPHEIDC